MFQFPAFASYPYVFEGKIPLNNSWKPEPHFHAVQTFQELEVGCPIRKSMDQSSFAAPHSLSQRITSFFACACQGIHQMPLRHLIVLIANAHHLASTRDAVPATFNNRNIHNAIDASDPVLIEATPSSFKAGS